MINLNTIAKEERLILFHNFEYNSLIRVNKKQIMLKVTDYLLTQHDINEFKQELLVLISHTTMSLKYGTIGFYLSLVRSHYIAANKQFKIKVCRERMRILLEYLDELGYITFYLGFYNPEENDSSLSAVKIESKLYELFENTFTTAVNQAMLRLVDEETYPNGIIEVVDSKETVVTKRFDVRKKEMIKTKDVVLKDTRFIPGVKELRKQLMAYNDLIAENTISIDLGKGQEISNCIVYKRRFEDDLTKCGRYYTLSTFQQLPSKFRPSIQINGNPTIELDFKNCHPRILADLEDAILKPDFDVYNIEKLFELGLTREHCKELLFCLLFTKTERDCINSIRLKLKGWNIGAEVEPKEVIRLYGNHNTYMIPYFFGNKFYQQLQNIDATIATLVINHFTAKGIVVLCYHDSFVIEVQHKDELYRMMEYSYRDVMSIKPHQHCNMVIHSH